MEETKDDAVFMLTPEESGLAMLLSELEHADFARIINHLSEEARDEVRSAIGMMIGKVRAAKLSKQECSEIARNAAEERSRKYREAQAAEETGR